MKRLSCKIQTCLKHTSVLQFVQGQSPKPGMREYFYYIDHQGMLFLDDARIKNFTSCFKEIKFLAFFFRQLRINDTNRFQGEFPYVSPCGREKNYVRCDDVPIVFTGLEKVRGELVLAYNYCGTELALPFQPHKLYMSRSSGRIYHPGPERLHGVGLIKSQMAIDFSHGFQFDEVGIPIHFTFNSTTYRLDNSLKSCLAVLGRKEES